jgi:hypothetical protein
MGCKKIQIQYQEIHELVFIFYSVGVWTGFIWFRIETNDGLLLTFIHSIHGFEPSVLMKSREILDEVSNCLLLRKGLAPWR